MAWREAQAPLSVPESDRQEVVLQIPPSPWRFPWIPTIPVPRWLVTYSAERRRAPLEPGRRGSRGEAKRRKKIIFHSSSQHDPDNSRLPFLVVIKLPLCLKLQDWKKKQRSKWKEGASKVNPLQGRSEHPFFKEQKKIYLFSPPHTHTPLPLLCLAIKSGFYVHSNGWGSQNMHMNEEEPHGTNISLQTDLHIYRPRNGA